MARYRKIDPRMWGDAKFRSLSPLPVSGQSFFIYLLTGPHTTNVPGLYHIGPATIAERMGWDNAACTAAYHDGCTAGLWVGDLQASVIRVPNAIYYNPPGSLSVVTGWRDNLAEIPECSLKTEHIKAIRDYLGSDRFANSSNRSNVLRDCAAYTRAFDAACSAGSSAGCIAGITPPGAGAGAGVKDVRSAKRSSSKKKRKPHPATAHMADLERLRSRYAELRSMEKPTGAIPKNEHTHRVCETLDERGLDYCVQQIEHHADFQTNDPRAKKTYNVWYSAFAYGKDDGVATPKVPNFDLMDSRIVGKKEPMHPADVAEKWRRQIEKEDEEKERLRTQEASQ